GRPASVPLVAGAEFPRGLLEVFGEPKRELAEVAEAGFVGDLLDGVPVALLQRAGGLYAFAAGALDFPAAERADANQEGGAKFFFARRREQAGGVQRAAAAVGGAASAPGFERGERERMVAGDRLMR